MSKNIKEKLENIKSVKLTSGEKNILWSKIEGGIRAREAYGKKPATVLGMSARLATVMVLMVFVLTSGSALTVSAANAAAPGDTLFPVDEAIERIELFFTRQENKTERRLGHAEERLEEARAILALIDTGDDEATSTDETSTSSDSSGGETSYESNKIARAEHVLDVALLRLEMIRDILVEEGNDEGVAEIDAVIAELTQLAEDHIAFLEGIESDIHGARSEIIEIRQEIKESRKELKFRFDYIVEDEEDEEGDEDDGEVKGTSRDRGFRFGRFFRINTNGNNGHKTVMCHVPPGNPDNAHTIAVGSPAAARAHIAHGDTKGSCNGNGGDGEGNEGGDENGEAKLTVIKEIVNDDNGTSTVEDFTLLVDGDEVDSGEENEFDPGDYTVSETGPDGYEATFSGDCDENGDITLEDGDDKICTITNDDVDEETDETAPVISSVDATSTTSTAEISWDTDEDADSEVWYSTSPSVDTSVASNESSATLEVSHSLPITGLTASTTYYYVVGSTDGFGNAATSTEDSFTTL